MYQEEKHNNIVFLGYNKDGEVKFASVRGTTDKKFRGDVTGSDKSYPFSVAGKTETVNVFESPIDLMSYMTLCKIHGKEFCNHAVSLGGVSDVGLTAYLKEHDELKNIILCLDSDEVGKKASEEIKNKYYSRYDMKIHKPKGKDFNDELVNYVAATYSIENLQANFEIDNNLINTDNKGEEECNANEDIDFEM